MKKLFKLLLVVCVMLLGSVGSTLMANEVDKLEDRNSVLKLGYQYTDDNSERSDTYNGYLRLKMDTVIYGRTFTFVPVSEYKYVKRDNVTSNDKYLISLLTETSIYGDLLHGYIKVSNDKDISNEIDNRNKYGLGVTHYIVKSKRFLFKLREGIQYTDTTYTVNNNLDNKVTYGKLGFLTGYYYNENMFLKAIVDYDIDLSNSNNVLEGKLGLEIKMTDKISLETLFKYSKQDDVPDGLSNSEKEITTSIVYQF